MPVLRRRRRLVFEDAHPLLRLGIRRALRQDDLNPEQRVALYEALDDSDILEAAYNSANEDMPETPRAGRDWEAFFNALANFIKAILPLIMELLKGFGLGGIPLPV